jgi:hypothetical protein
MVAFIGLGFGEMLIIGFVALLLFGRRLPELFDRCSVRLRPYQSDDAITKLLHQMERARLIIPIMFITGGILVVLIAAYVFRDIASR